MSRTSILALLALSSGCAGDLAAHRIVPPTAFARPMTGSGPDHRHVQVRVSKFAVAGGARRHRSRDQNTRFRILRGSFLGYLAGAARYGELHYSDAPGDVNLTSRDLQTVDLEAVVTAGLDSGRTYLLDAVFFFPFLGSFPLTPVWGDATVEVTVWHVAGQARTKIAYTRVDAPYSMLFYSWYRTGPVETAVGKAYHAAFEDIATQVAKAMESIAARPPAEVTASAASVTPEASVATASVTADASRAGLAHRSDRLHAELDALEARTSSASRPHGEGGVQPELTVAAEAREEDAAGRVSTSSVAASPVEDDIWALESQSGLTTPKAADPWVPPPLPRVDGSRRLLLKEEGWTIRTRPREHQDRGWLLRYVASLGGLEAAYLRGGANVQSRARVRDGSTQTVGTGGARSEGFKLSFFKPPDRTGFFFPPTAGFLSQTITIEGFVEEVPVFPLPGSIGARFTDPATGLEVDPAEPINYLLRLKSGFVGQQVGFNFVTGNDHVELFATFRGGLNFFELRHTDVELHTTREKGFTFELFKSGLVATQVGVVFPDIHIALRASYQFEWYLQFDFPEEIDFLAHSTFNPEKKTFERQRVFVDAAKLTQFNGQLSVIYMF